MQGIAPIEVKAWAAKEVVKEVNGRPHLLVRVDVEGTHFPSRAIPPFLRIVTGRRVVDAWFTEETADQRSLVGYFRPDVPGGVLECGYGREVVARAPTELDPRRIARLDPKRLPQEVVVPRDDAPPAKGPRADTPARGGHPTKRG